MNSLNVFLNSGRDLGSSHTLPGLDVFLLCLLYLCMNTQPGGVSHSLSGENALWATLPRQNQRMRPWFLQSALESCSNIVLSHSILKIAPPHEAWKM